MTTQTGDAQATGSIGLTTDQAAQALERLLADDGDSQADETLEAEKPQASDDAEGDEPNAEDEEQSDETEDQDDAEEQPATVTVKVDGKELQVTQDELVRGYQREADYTRKTMEIGEVRKAVEAEKSTASAKRTEYETALGQLETFWSNTGLPDDDSDIAHLRYADPAEWAAQMAERGSLRHQAQQRSAAIKAERERIAQERMEEERGAQEARAKEEADKLKAALPDWADPAKAAADTKMIAKYAEERGITPAELGELQDHRLVLVLRDAAKYRALQAKKPEVQKALDAPKPARPGSMSKPAVSDLTRSKQRLAKTGRVEDAAAALMHLIR